MAKGPLNERVLRKFRHLIEESGEYLMSGNEAVARGAIEAGIRVAASYPGTPASDILEAISAVAKYHNIYAEWSTNEKVAFEVAYAAALTGLRALVSSKHLGINVLSDTLLVSAYTGVNGGLVLISVDDIHPWSSQNAEDTRYYARLAKIPCLEPTSPAEAKEVVKFAFELSEELQLPVMVRYTERLADNLEIVKVDEIDKKAKSREPKFIPDPERYVMIAPHTRKNHPILNKKILKAEKIFNECCFNTVSGSSRAELGIIASGIAYRYVMETLYAHNLFSRVRVLKLVTTHPVPRQLIAKFLATVNKVLVVEEIEPILEREIKEIAQSERLTLGIYGRISGHIPREYELNPTVIEEALGRILGIPLKRSETLSIDGLVIPRIPYLCAGCPHRISYLAIKAALRKLRKRGIIVGDRGCYNQGVHPPLRAIDMCVAMGASIGMACGFSKAGVKEPIIAVIGDSTFFHAGLSALANAVFNRAKITVIILDNEITAMTGHQPNPATGKTAMGEEVHKLYLEIVAQALGVKFVEVVDTNDFDYMVEVIEKAIEYPETSVVVIRSPCALEVMRKGEIKKKYRVVEENCIGCKACILITGCPALEMGSDSKVRINPAECTGCGVCVVFCPRNAIVLEGE